MKVPINIWKYPIMILPAHPALLVNTAFASYQYLRNNGLFRGFDRGGRKKKKRHYLFLLRNYMNKKKKEK